MALHSRPRGQPAPPQQGPANTACLPSEAVRPGLTQRLRWEGRCPRGQGSLSPGATSEVRSWRWEAPVCLGRDKGVPGAKSTDFSPKLCFPQGGPATAQCRPPLHRTGRRRQLPANSLRRSSPQTKGGSPSGVSGGACVSLSSRHGLTSGRARVS